jgi:hypothetical protein
LSFPGTFNIRYYKGDLYQFTIRPKQSTGEPFPISSETHNAFFYISTQRGVSTAQLSNTPTIVAQATIVGGNVLATIPPSVGNTLTANVPYFYDVSIQGKGSNSNQVYTLVTGTLSVTFDITGPS